MAIWSIKEFVVRHAYYAKRDFSDFHGKLCHLFHVTAKTQGNRGEKWRQSCYGEETREKTLTKAGNIRKKYIWEYFLLWGQTFVFFWAVKWHNWLDSDISLPNSLISFSSCSFCVLQVCSASHAGVHSGVCYAYRSLFVAFVQQGTRDATILDWRPKRMLHHWAESWGRWVVASLLHTCMFTCKSETAVCWI